MNYNEIQLRSLVGWSEKQIATIREHYVCLLCGDNGDLQVSAFIVLSRDGKKEQLLGVVNSLAIASVARSLDMYNLEITDCVLSTQCKVCGSGVGKTPESVNTIPKYIVPKGKSLRDI